MVRDSGSGHSLVELMIVLGILSAFVVAGAIALRKPGGSDSSVRAGQELAVAALRETRRESIALQTRCRLLVINDPDSPFGNLLPVAWKPDSGGRWEAMGVEIRLPFGVRVRVPGEEDGSSSGNGATQSSLLDGPSEYPDCTDLGSAWHIEFDNQGRPASGDYRIVVGTNHGPARAVRLRANGSVVAE